MRQKSTPQQTVHRTGDNLLRQLPLKGSLPQARVARARATPLRVYTLRELRADLTPGFGPLELFRADIVGTATFRATSS